MDKLFKNLPRDLQWEVLTVFVGSHAVRKGKLIQKLESGVKFQQIQDMARIEKCYIGQYIVAFNTMSFVQLSNGSQLMFCECPYTGYMGYKFRQVLKRECSWMPKAYGLQYTSLTYSAPLPPFEKHTYPSYEDTDKKKALRFSKKIADLAVEEPKRLSLIRPCDIAENEEFDKLRAFEGMSPLTDGGFRTPDEPLPSPPWLTQFLIDI
jgi:hypothetical protein